MTALRLGREPRSEQTRTIRHGETRWHRLEQNQLEIVRSTGRRRARCVLSHGSFLVRHLGRIRTEGGGCDTMLFGTFFRHRLLEENHLLGNLTRLDLVRRDRNIRRGWDAGRYRFVSNRFFGQIL
ncbi:MAG: hypothetical protein ACLP7Q_11980 [Isosphaeraceae bacterium]